jgi:GNAT superfamily N-acetyltransferase
MAYTEPGLLAGWEPEAPLGDTLLRRFLLNWTAWFEVLHPVAAVRRDDLVATNLGRQAGLLHGAMLLVPLDRDTAGDTLRAIDGLYAGTPAGEVLLFSPWPTPDLRPYGWRLEGHPPLMMRPPGEALRGRDAVAPRQRDTDLRIEEVRDAEGLREFERVVVTGYPFDGVDLDHTLLDAVVLRDGRMRCWIGWSEGRAVSAVSVFTAAGINDVTVLATLPEARRRGYGETLMWAATRADPQLPAMLLSSDLGRSVYERMGYLPLARFTVWNRQFGGSA